MVRERFAVPALLVVGEGDAELVLLKHVKALYVGRGGGRTARVIGGRGKGGRGVIDYVISQSRGTEFDARLALLDTDTDWDDEQRARAKSEGIAVVESDPCLEAWLLDVQGFAGNRDSAGHKAEFRRRFGGPAHDKAVITRNFSRNALDEARKRVRALDELLTFLGA